MKQINEYKKNRNRFTEIEKNWWFSVAERRGEEQHRGMGLRGANYYA